MISIVLYGRNDDHGYNLHKRVAIGINCMAAVLSQPDDEILFVDYNTPDDYPTLPEAIADTLTEAAAARLRILRVRPSIHARYALRTSLNAVEPVARNVAIRRSNPANRWVLSTNSDMIFVPRSAGSLSEIVAGLDHGFYHLPRFELPELLWEGFDRCNARAMIEEVETLGRTMFLNEIVYARGVVKYDSPGDFQLIARDDLFRIHGFDEDMLLGWHVDSNMARRLTLLHGHVGDLARQLCGYHCDHTRQITPTHRDQAARNSVHTFVDSITRAELPRQISWGCADDDIEEFTLGQGVHRRYVSALGRVLTGEYAEPPVARYTPDGFDDVHYDARHVMPFIADLLGAAPRQWTAGWIGGRADSFELFCRVWAELGFTGRVIVPEWASELLPLANAAMASSAPLSTVASSADVLLMDFGRPSDAGEHPQIPVDGKTDRAVAALVRRDFADLVSFERDRASSTTLRRRFICINAIHNTFEALVLKAIASPLMPFATRLRHGFVRADSVTDEGAAVPANPSLAGNLIGTMHIGESGQRVEGGVLAVLGRRGVVLHGPHRGLPPGRYRAEIVVKPTGPWSLGAFLRPIVLEIAAGAERLQQHRWRFFLGGTKTLTFSVSLDHAWREPIYIRVICGRWVAFMVESVRLAETVEQFARSTADVHAPAADGAQSLA